jgi:polysaccharide biosynthesis/export protein
MKGKKDFSRAILVSLILSAAVVQGKAQGEPATSGTNQSSRNSSENTLAAKQATLHLGSPSTAKSDQPANQVVKPQSPDKVQSPAPFVEDFPASDENPESVPPRSTLPVIVSSESPSLDREVSRKDIAPVPDDYIIGEEDVLTITIWKEHDLSGSLVVRPDGKITVPLVGEVYVVGMKPVQLQTLLEEKLKPFITVPQVSIAINQINSRKIYLIGQVVREGTFPINSSMTVLQVLSAAGGLRDFAKRKKIYILRKHGDQEIRFPFDYDAAIHGRNREENIEVQPGDTIVVP